MRSSLSRHSVLCRNNGAGHCVATRLCARDKEALSQQCDTALRRGREGHARVTNQVRHV